MPTDIRQFVSSYYSKKLEQFGPTANGVDWRDGDSQRLRFQQLIKIVDDISATRSLVDYGCGVGALVDYLDERGIIVDYSGYDWCAEMIEQARQMRPETSQYKFHVGEPEGADFDYAVASGIFNVKGEVEVAEWKTYVTQTLDRINAIARRGFSFNMLTSYSDAEKMRPHLYYPDPSEVFDFCKRRYSRNVALLHDYDLYEFTILVRKTI